MTQDTCDACYPIPDPPPSDGYTVKLCPLHRVAPVLVKAAQDALNKVVRSDDKSAYKVVNEMLAILQEAITATKETP